MKKFILDDQKKKIGLSLSFSASSRRIRPRMRGRIEYTLNCNLEIAPMIRILGLTVALVVPLGLATTAHAQTTPYNGGGAIGPYYGVSGYGGSTLRRIWARVFPGGAGRGMVMDQYGLWHAVPYVAVGASVAAAQPQPRARTTRSASVGSRQWHSRVISSRLVLWVCQAQMVVCCIHRGRVTRAMAAATVSGPTALSTTAACGMVCQAATDTA